MGHEKILWVSESQKEDMMTEVEGKSHAPGGGGGRLRGIGLWESRWVVAREELSRYAIEARDCEGWESGLWV